MAHSNDSYSILISEDFLKCERECNLLLDDLRLEHEHMSLGVINFADESKKKEIAIFENTYLELREWLQWCRGMMNCRRNTSLSRCESYLSQDYLIGFTARETDMNRLRTIGNKLKSLEVSNDCDKVPHAYKFRTTRIVEKLEEIEVLWEVTTAELAVSSYQCNYDRTIRHIELDIQEAEAKLRSIQRQTSHLYDLITNRGPIEPGDFNSSMGALKVQHGALKHVVHTLMAVDQLINRLFQSAADPVFHTLTEALTTTSLQLDVARDEVRLTGLIAHVHILIDACQETWLCQLELRERWKLRSLPDALSNDVSGQKTSTHSGPLSSEGPVVTVPVNHATCSGSLNTSVCSPLLDNPFSQSSNLQSHGTTPSYQPAVSNDRNCQTECVVSHIHDAPRTSLPISGTTSASSLVCKESGFGSDSDQNPSSPSPSEIHWTHMLTSSWPRRCPVGLKQIDCIPRTESIYRLKPDVPRVRSLSVDCLWNRNVSVSGSDLASLVLDITRPDSVDPTYYTALDLTPTKPKWSSEAVPSKLLTPDPARTCDANSGHSVAVKFLSSGSIGVPCNSTTTEAKSDNTGVVTSSLNNIPIEKNSIPSQYLTHLPDSFGLVPHPTSTGVTMPIAIYSPTDSGPLPQYTSSPTNFRHRHQFTKPISFSLVAGMDDTSTMDFNAILQTDEVDDTTFSEVAQSITELDTGSSTSPAVPSMSCDNALTAADAGLSCEVKRDHPNHQQKWVLQNNLDHNGGGIHRDVNGPSPESFNGANDGLEWDNSGDLQGGMRTESGSLSSGFGPCSLPLANESKNCPNGDAVGGCWLGSLPVSQSTVEQLPFDQPRRSSFTLAAEAAEALVAGLTRRGQRRMSSSSAGVGSQLCHATATKVASDDRPSVPAIPGKSKDGSNKIENGDNKIHRASQKYKLPPVCCSTPTHRASDIDIHNRVGSNDRVPVSSESPTVPVSVTSMFEMQPKQTNGSTEAKLSLFSNHPLDSLVSRLHTSSCVDNPSDLTNDADSLTDAMVNHTWEECSENPVVLLGLIRSREAVPLLGLLDRLEQGSPQRNDHTNLAKHSCTASGTVAHELGNERAQLDIDRSFLQFYTKELNHWQETADSLRSSAMCDTCGSSKPASLHVDKTLLAIDSFCDWLAALRNRVAVCLNHLNRRALWIDQLNGFSHELRSSFTVVEERVHSSLRRARETLLLWRQRRNEAALRCSNQESAVRAPSIMLNRGQILQTLDNLQNLSDNVLTFQVRLGSCHLINDCWSSNDLFRPVPCVLRVPITVDDNQSATDHVDPQTPSDESSSFCSFLDPTTEDATEPSECTSASLHAITERAEQLQRRLRSAIKQLERAVVYRMDSIPTQPLVCSGQAATVDCGLSMGALTSVQPTEAVVPASHVPSRLQTTLIMKPHSWYRPTCILALIFLCFAFLFYQCVPRFDGLVTWLSRIHPFCPHRPGTVIVDFSPNWWVRALACLQLPNTKDVTW